VQGTESAGAVAVGSRSLPLTRKGSIAHGIGGHMTLFFKSSVVPRPLSPPTLHGQSATVIPTYLLDRPTP